MASRFATLIPPKLASPASLGSHPNAARMTNVVSFYSRLPKGPAPKVTSANPITRYRQRYFEGGSAAPVVHILFWVAVMGYTFHYNMHLKHHKNNAH
ncbi:ATP synthase subunit F [Atractiella rhizophila]|nr:ATP synthase subunit F [Atractiella rhizophila]